MIERAAKGVAKAHPGSVLDVGDISRKSGGDLHGHHSHESGRDVDLGFYAMDAKGKPIQTRSFLKFDASLSSSSVHGARFDVARNWLLVQHMLTDPSARVSHIFIAEPLRQSLLAHARSRGVSRALLNRAAVAMMQPTSSLPHDDHMHVRISCPSSMRGECVELAKNAPSARTRLAKARRRGVSPVLRTPSAGRSARANAVAPGAATTARASDRGEKRGDRQGLSRAEPAQQPEEGSILRRAIDAVESAIQDEPDTSQEEAEADAAEVKDAIDESGAPKITD